MVITGRSQVFDVTHDRLGALQGRPRRRQRAATAPFAYGLCFMPRTVEQFWAEDVIICEWPDGLVAAFWLRTAARPHRHNANPVAPRTITRSGETVDCRLAGVIN